MFYVKMFLSVMWAIPWTILGAALCITVVFFPFGLVCFGIAGWPASKTMDTRWRQNYRLAKYNEQYRRVQEASTGTQPWFAEQDGVDDVL